MDRRGSRRIDLKVPLRVRFGDGTAKATVAQDVSLLGMALPGEEARPGQEVELEFDGYPGVCEPFSVSARVVRRLGTPGQPAWAVEIDRQANPAETLQQYRTLVRHYLHHKPLLDEVGGYLSESRCTECGWIGHVGRYAQHCPSCRGPVEPVSR